MSLLFVKLLALVSVLPKVIQSCQINTGGTCWWLDCFTSRGPTECINGACICESDFCAEEGRCVPEKSRLAAPNATTSGVALAEVGANPLVPLTLVSGVFLIAFLPVGAAIMLTRRSHQPLESALLDADGQSETAA
mmetsp:Transcript_61799/g.164287  ORF Transcript_61799/g.164287 Transcript_61799/m.164287 type:complete len:136 (-) Transcript_61799:194-601(-)